jgi:anaerobic magnesium-protoporphyrin IX monomethyl ester cyclase
MKVLLVRSRPTKVQNTRLPASLAREVGYIMPLGIACIAGFLRENGVAVSILDAEAEGLSLHQMKQRFAECKPDVVGVTSMTPTVHDDLDVASIAKEMGAKVVIGGPQANAMPVETLSCENVDFVVQGEGELPMLRLLDALNDLIPFSEVPGLMYIEEDGRIKQNAPFINNDLDSLPFPAWDLMPFELYHSIISKDRLATVSPNRGCPFHCGFCFKQPSDKKVRFRNPYLVADEIEMLVKDFKVKEINLVSDTLTVKKDFVFLLCEEIIKRNLTVSWIAPTRADCVTKEMLRIMKRAGCRSLRFGVESGSPRILESMRKECDLETMARAFRWAREIGIETFAYLIVGYIYETEESAQETLDFVNVIKPDLLMYNFATPMPGTRLWEQVVAEGMVDPDYWKRFINDRNMPRIPYLFKDAEKWIKKGYRDFYFSPRVIMKQALAFRPGSIKPALQAFRGLLRL